MVPTRQSECRLEKWLQRLARLPVRAEHLALVARVAHRLHVAVVELALQAVEEDKRIEQPLPAKGLRTVQLGPVPVPRIADGQDVVLVEVLADGREAVVGKAIKSLVAPGGPELVLRSVFGTEPIAELHSHLLPERRTGLERRHRRIEEDALLVDDLDVRDDRVLGVGQARVRVLVLEQVEGLADLHVLQFRRVRHSAMRRREAVVIAECTEFLQVGDILLVSRAELQRTKMGREQHVNACFFELRHLIVHPVEARRIEFDAAFLGLNPGPARPIHVLVQPHGVDAVLGIERRPLVGQRLLRRTGAVAQVDAPEFDRLAIVVELVFFARDPAMLTCRLREPVLHPNLPRLRRVPRREYIPGGHVRGVGARFDGR